NHVSIHFVDRALAIISRKVRRYTNLRPLKGSASVATHEWRKLLLTGRAVWILLAALIIAVNLWDTSPLMMGSIDDATYKLYANHWSGDLTEESIREIEAENAYLLSIPDQMKALTMQMRAGLIDEGDYYRAYETLRNYSEQRSKGFDELYTQYARVKALRGGIRPAIVDRLSSNFYFDNETRDLLMGLLLVLLIVLALGRAFPLDEEKGLSPILRCTAGGRRELTLSKLTASLVCALVLWFLTFLPTMTTLLVKYNLSFTSDLQNIDLYSDSTLMVSIGVFVVLMETLRLLGAVTAAVWVLYITKSVKKLSMGIILSASVLGLPFLLMFLELGFMRWLGLAAAFTPYQAALAPAWQLGIYAAALAVVCALGIWLLIRERSVKR
ncbi:MAG: hypothetical protein IKM07_02495, partial [Clostridia bacterium]|nr:hypothetical protein [Clostridia bacterium]